MALRPGVSPTLCSLWPCPLCLPPPHPCPGPSQTVNLDLANLGLQRCTDQPAGTDNCGNKQKLATAGALVGDPEVKTTAWVRWGLGRAAPVLLGLIPDPSQGELTTGVDPSARRFFWRSLLAAVQKGCQWRSPRPGGPCAQPHSSGQSDPGSGERDGAQGEAVGQSLGTQGMGGLAPGGCCQARMRGCRGNLGTEWAGPGWTRSD